MMIRQIVGGAVLALATALPAAAEKIALAIGNIDYESQADAPDANRVLLAARALSQMPGVTATVARDATLADLRALQPQFLQMANQSDGQVIVLSGKFATDGVETFFLPVDMSDPALLRLYRQAEPLSLYISLLHNAPAGGVLILAPANSSGDSGPNWDWGLGPLSVPDNVAIVHGTPRAVADLVRDVLPNPRRSIRDAVAGTRQLSAVGSLPEDAFLEPGDDADRVRERLAWELATSFDNLQGYRSYLENFPGGAHADEARARIRALSAPTPEQVESALNLTREERRSVQRDLTVLGFNTRGIDGIFGPGTRRAIADWQQEQGFESTGYLTRLQVGRLERLAAARRQEIAAEDDAYWARNGADGSFGGLTRYLERYPNGRHAGEARAALEEIEEKRALGIERQAWDQAREADTVGAYEGYLEAYPQGRFAGEARNRIAEIQAEQQDRRQAGLAEERALNLSPIARLLVERRLEQAGYAPGPVDGSFDQATRNAIRRFQIDQQIAVSGFVTEATVAALLVGGLRDLRVP